MSEQTPSALNQFRRRDLFNEIKNPDGRVYRTFISVTREGYNLFDLHVTFTFSGSEKPDQHRTLWRASLPGSSLRQIQQSIQDALTSSRDGFESDPIPRPYCVLERRSRPVSDR